MKTSSFKLFWASLLAAFLVVPYPLWAATWDLRFIQLDGSSIPRSVVVTATANSVIAFASNQAVVSKAITGPGGVSVTHNNTNIVLGLANTAVTPGSYTNAIITVTSDGRIVSAENGAASGGGEVPSSRTISVTTPLNGGGDFSANRTIGIDNATTTTKGAASFNGTHFDVAAGAVSIKNTTVTPGSYTNANITVGPDGRITSAANGSAEGGSGTVDTSGSPSSGQAAQFSGSNTITGVGVVGTGNYVKDTAPAIAAANLTGVVTRNGATILTPATMGASVVNTAGINSKTVSGNLTITFNSTPSANTVFIATLENSTGSALTHAIPSSVPWGQASAVTSVNHPANSKIRLMWEYTGSVYMLAVLTTTSSGGSVAVADITDLGTGVGTFLTVPSGSNLAGALTSPLPASKGGTGLTALAANVVSLLGAADYAALRGLLDLEVGTDLQAFDADLSDLADGELTGSKVGAGINGSNITSGTVADARIDAAIARDSEVAAAYLPLTGVGQKQEWVVPLGDETTTITTGTKVTFRAPYACTVTAVRASLTTQSSSGTPTFDINEGGTSILSTKLTIDSGEKTSTSAAAAAVISDTAFADDAEITIDIDTAGTGAAGAKVTIYVTRS